MKIAQIICLTLIAAGLMMRPAALFAAESSTPAVQSVASVPESKIQKPKSNIESPQSEINPELPSLSDALTQISHKFSWIDWSVIAGYLIFTTILGAKLAGRQATIRDFFLGGRKLPWYAVWGSIIATEFSAASFLIAPAIVFKMGGNLTYFQLAIGTILARFLIGFYFVPAFFEREIYSPYDYMGHRLGERVRKITSLLFIVGAVLGQGVRVYIAALAFQVVTGTDIRISIALMMAFSILWAWIGGIRTVIWTDFIQFILFTVGAVVALLFIGYSVEGGLPQIFRESWQANKLRLIDTTFDTKTAYTLWCGLLATVWLTLASHGTDQLNAQRMFTCRDARDARKAIIWSSAAQTITLCLLLVGAGLYVYYQHHPLTPVEQAIVAKRSDSIFAVFIVNVMPRGISGLVMAAIFAAAISTIESALAALAQSTQSNLPPSLSRHLTTPRREVLLSRALVIAWGIVLTLFAISCNTLKERFGDLIQFALAMTAYTYGPLLGTFLLAFLPIRRNDLGLLWGVPLAMMTVFALQYNTPMAVVVVSVTAAVLLTAAVLRLDGNPGKIAVIAFFAGLVLLIQTVAGPKVPSDQPILIWPWHFPIGTLITFVVGYLVGEPRTEEGEKESAS